MVPQFLTPYASLDCAAAALADEAGSKYSKGWALGVRNERLVATFENTVMIGRPIEEVFGFLADFENVPSGTPWPATSGSSRNCWSKRPRPAGRS
jgi:hypothetical protein